MSRFDDLEKGLIAAVMSANEAKHVPGTAKALGHLQNALHFALSGEEYWVRRAARWLRLADDASPPEIVRASIARYVHDARGSAYMPFVLALQEAALEELK